MDGSIRSHELLARVITEMTAAVREAETYGYQTHADIQMGRMAGVTETLRQLTEHMYDPVRERPSSLTPVLVSGLMREMTRLSAMFITAGHVTNTRDAGDG